MLIACRSKENCLIAASFKRACGAKKVPMRLYLQHLMKHESSVAKAID